MVGCHRQEWGEEGYRVFYTEEIGVTAVVAHEGNLEAPFPIPGFPFAMGYRYDVNQFCGIEIDD
jgi:hypothetical protein